MTDAREAILETVRRSLIGGDRRSTAGRIEIQERINNGGAHVRPVITGDLIKIFCEKHLAVHGTIDRLLNTTDIVGAFSRYFDAYDITPDLVIGSGPILDQLNWPVDWKVEQRCADVHDRIVVSEAFCAVAETGTLVFFRTPQVPTSHLFFAEDHLVLLDATLITRHQEEVWLRLRSRDDVFPAAVNFITGPSKTGDVEQTIEYGAHGPRRVHIFLIDQ